MVKSTSVLAAAFCVAGSLGLARPAEAQVVVSLPFIAPPEPAFVATTPPVYYEGHASYWYHDRWVYRDGRGWHGYDREPAYLHEHRARAVVRPRYEGHRR
jgi:hypothetical protein